MAFSGLLLQQLTPPSAIDHANEATDTRLRQAAAQDQLTARRRAFALSILNGVQTQSDPIKQAELYARLRPMVLQHDSTLDLPDTYDADFTKALLASTGQSTAMTPYQEAQINALNERNAINREKMSAAKTGKALPRPVVNDLKGAAENYETMTRLTKGFKPEFAGNTVTGGLENLAGRLGGESVGLTDPGQTQWWQDYQGYVNQVRNELFGAALTATEKAEFEKSIIKPGMDPEQAASNLARQQAIVQTALTRLGSTYEKGGYNTDQIREYVPEGLERIDTTNPEITPGAKTTATPKVGTIMDGYVFMGGDPADQRSWKPAR
jgi:hypothetical protein